MMYQTKIGVFLYFFVLKSDWLVGVLKLVR
jgi:hypothetical protein